MPLKQVKYVQLILHCDCMHANRTWAGLIKTFLRLKSYIVFIKWIVVGDIWLETWVGAWQHNQFTQQSLSASSSSSNSQYHLQWFVWTAMWRLINGDTQIKLSFIANMAVHKINGGIQSNNDLSLTEKWILDFIWNWNRYQSSSVCAALIKCFFPLVYISEFGNVWNTIQRFQSI